MRSPASPVAPTSSFVGEVSFAKADNFIRSLTALQIGKDAPLSILLRADQGDAAFYAAAAAALAIAESRSAAPLRELPLLALCDEGPEGHPLNWLNVTERKKDEERRQCHEWYLTLEENGKVHLTFEHGKFGYRKEPFASWSAAFSRLAELLAGTCTWHHFGDHDSRHTMLGKGQFYWQAPRTAELVPVDNFVYALAGRLELTLAGVSHRSVLTFVQDPKFVADSESSKWFDDYAQGLLRMADILDGVVTFTEFDQETPPLLKAASTLEDEFDPLANALWAPAGQFVVKSIYLHGDEHLAPVLTYMTGEKAQVQLLTADDAWTVRVCDAEHPWRERKFEPANASDALRTLADVLTGAQRWDEFDEPS
jgi:hypothetical protein